MKTDPQFFPANRIGARALRRTAQALRRERRATLTRLSVAFSLFVALLASAFLVGSKVVIGPSARSVAPAGEASRPAEIVLALPDRTFCRHLSFDNATAEFTADKVEPCPGNPTRKRAPTGFAWGGR